MMIDQVLKRWLSGDDQPTCQRGSPSTSLLGTLCGFLAHQAGQPGDDDYNIRGLNDDDYQKHEDCGDNADDGDFGFDDHRNPTRFETNLILVTIAPLNWGHPLPGDYQHYH